MKQHPYNLFFDDRVFGEIRALIKMRSLLTKIFILIFLTREEPLFKSVLQRDHLHGGHIHSSFLNFFLVFCHGILDDFH